MNAAELKLDLFRRIDGMSQEQLEKIYKRLIDVLENNSVYELSDVEIHAVNEAVAEPSKYLEDDIKKDAQRNYPNLRF
jgi:ribosomal protein S13